MVVDHTRICDVNFTKDAFHVLFGHLRVALSDCASQLFNLDCTRAISINLIEFFSKFKEFTRVHHLDKDL